MVLYLDFPTAECDQDKEKNVELEMNIDLLKGKHFKLLFCISSSVFVSHRVFNFNNLSLKR